MKKLTLALVLTAFASAAPVVLAAAHDAVGVAKDVKGVVTVSHGNTMGNLVNDLNIVDGMRLAATSTGGALIKLKNGCDISLAANQSIVIDTALDCKALMASVKTAPAGGGGGGGFAAGGGFGGALPIGLALGYGAGVRNWTKQTKSSGS